jgi:hypothetical protein
MHTGHVVWANTGGRDFLALFVAHDGDKDKVQVPDGSVVLLAHREPNDRDANGSGMTWWTV